MPILPLPQFEADLKAYEEDQKVYERLKPPTSIVVRFGVMKLVGEFPYSGDSKPGCGSKLVIRSHRGTEIGEMLTSTCPNAGCSKSVSRKEMLEYIDNSGGKDYPFFNQGKVLRVATAEDMAEQARLDEMRQPMVRHARVIAEQLNLPMKVVEAEPILGGDRLTFYFASEERIDFREMVNILARDYSARIELRQIGSRDEARLTADYERCGQHCCCKQFLKVLKPVSMKSAKIQKATLDPLKISGRCGRLMCCLRYEDESYDELRAKLPRKKTRVKTDDGWGYVVDTQILTQLVLVRLDAPDGLPGEKEIAVPLEDLLQIGGPGSEPGAAPLPAPPPVRDDGVGTGAPGAGRPASRGGPGVRGPDANRPQGPQRDNRAPAQGARPGGQRAPMPAPPRQPTQGAPQSRPEAQPPQGGGMPRPRDLGSRPPSPPRQQPPRPADQPPSASSGDANADIDDVLDEGTPDDGSPEQGPPTGGASEGERRRRRRRRRRGGRGGDGQSGGPGGPQSGGDGGGSGRGGPPDAPSDPR